MAHAVPPASHLRSETYFLGEIPQTSPGINHGARKPTITPHFHLGERGGNAHILTF